MNSMHLICMLFLFIATSSLVESYARATKEKEFGIIGAKRACIQKYPHTVSTYSRVNGRVMGNGAVLNHNWIFSTASQLYGMGETDIIVRGGTNDSMSGGQFTNVTKLITNFTDYEDVDIALLKTETRLKFDATLKPIKLATFIPKFDSMAVLSGFGSGPADDLGAPLVQKGKLVGVYIGCYLSEPFVFTRVANVRSWILDNIKKNSVGDEAEGIDFGID